MLQMVGIGQLILRKSLVPRTGFEPVISTLKGWRPNRARRPGREGILLQSGVGRQRLDAYRALLIAETLRARMEPKTIGLSPISVGSAVKKNSRIYG